MLSANEVSQLEFHDWKLKVRPPAGNNTPRLTLMIHGWSGDENVMWIFASHLPHDGWVIAPRGPVSAPDGGYGWVPHRDGYWPTIEDFRQPAQALIALIDDWISEHTIGNSRIRLLGFSQGAAMSLALALLYPQRIERAAVLSGFMPSGIESYPPDRRLEGLPFYVAHGTLDETVPVEQARRMVAALERFGAQVTYCESQVGHKLSIECLHGLSHFFAQAIS